MPKSKPHPVNKRRRRLQRQPRDPGPDRKRASREVEELDEYSDGIVDSEMEEFDTDRYEIPQQRH